MATLTDKKLAVLLNNISTYASALKRKTPILNETEIYNELYNSVYYSLQQGGMFSDITDIAEQKKMYAVLDTFWDATQPSQWIRPKTVSVGQRSGSYPSFPDIYHPYGYGYNNTFVFINLSPGGSCHSHTAHHSHHGSGGCCSGGGGDCSEGALIMILVGIVIAISAGLALAASFYLLREIANNLERMYFNEGWLHAGLSFMCMSASVTVSAMFAHSVLTLPLIAFLLGVGFANPVGLAIFTALCLTGMMAAIGYGLTQVIQNYALSQLNSDALCPNDAYRFTLTPAEARALENTGIDPLKVKCAMVALQATLSEGAVTNQYGLFSSRDEHTEEVLTKIRKLRSGDLYSVRVESSDSKTSMVFDCRKKDEIVVEAIAVGVPVDNDPSAPPYYSMK